MVLASQHYENPSVNAKMLYHMRNRVIAEIADLVVIVEVRPSGGSMHQIVWAIKRGDP